MRNKGSAEGDGRPDCRSTLREMRRRLRSAPRVTISGEVGLRVMRGLGGAVSQSGGRRPRRSVRPLPVCGTLTLLGRKIE